MSDELVYKIFVELAVQKGVRELGGKWKSDKPGEISKILKKARRLVANEPIEDDDSTDTDL